MCVCDLTDMRALGTMQSLLLYEAGTKKDGAHTCFELRRSQAQIFFCLRGEAYIFRYYLANEINIHMYKKVATALVALDNRS